MRRSPAAVQRVVVAPDKFKGSARAIDVAAALSRGMRSARPDVEVVELPVADGGDGTVEAALGAGFAPVRAIVPGVLGAPIEARFAEKHGTAVVELAEVVGLARLPVGTLAPFDSGTEGLGRLISLALDRGCRRLVIGIGGSASTDGGAGMLVGLGARLLDSAGLPVGPGVPGLERAVRLDLTGVDRRLQSVDVVLATDVDNPLLGPRGAASIFGPQKGAGPRDVRRLEAALTWWSQLVAEAVGRDLAACPAAGAAGGTGLAALAVVGAKPRPGIDVVLEILNFAAHLAGVALVVTGEGRLDRQTLGGKAPAGVARACVAQRVPVVAVAGSCTLDADQLRVAGFEACYELVSLVTDPAEAVRDPLPLLAEIGAEIAHRHLVREPSRR